MSTANRNGDEIWIRKHRKHRNKEVIGIRKAKRSTADRNEDVIGGLGKQRGVKPTEMRTG